MPIDLDCPGDVADVVEENVLIRLDDLEAGSSQVCGQPLRGHQAIRMCVIAERGGGVCCYGHFFFAPTWDRFELTVTILCVRSDERSLTRIPLGSGFAADHCRKRQGEARDDRVALGCVGET
jgi:hypothetical protein